MRTTTMSDLASHEQALLVMKQRLRDHTEAAIALAHADPDAPTYQHVVARARAALTSFEIARERHRQAMRIVWG